MFRKREFDMIYYAYLNESSFKYYISILGGGGGLRSCIFCLFRGRWGVQNLGKPAYIILARSPIVEGYLKNKGDFKNKYDLRYKDKLEMVTIPKMMTTSYIT